jgi:Cu2+-exporting ATPase
VDRARLGSLRLSNPVLYRKSALTQALERELMSVLGVHRYDTDSLKCRVDIEYDPRQLSTVQLIEILDGRWPAPSIRCGSTSWTAT